MLGDRRRLPRARRRKAPFAIGRGEVHRLRLTSWGLEIELLKKLADGFHRVRITKA